MELSIIAKQLVRHLSMRGQTCATAESCTGGGVGSAITAVPGSSAVFWGGVISYDNSVKRNVLGVDETVLEGVGPVSELCAVQMAEGVRKLLKTDMAVSVTGLAGPGGDEKNPQGCVWLGIASKNGTRTENIIFKGDRDEVRMQAAAMAMKMLIAESANM